MASFLWVVRWRNFFKNQLDVFQKAVERVSESFSHENLEEDAFEAAAGSHPEEGMEIAAEHYINRALGSEYPVVGQFELQLSISALANSYPA